MARASAFPPGVQAFRANSSFGVVETAPAVKRAEAGKPSSRKHCYRDALSPFSGCNRPHRNGQSRAWVVMQRASSNSARCKQRMQFVAAHGESAPWVSPRRAQWLETCSADPARTGGTGQKRRRAAWTSRSAQAAVPPARGLSRPPNARGSRTNWGSPHTNEHARPGSP